jgi:putative ABC transport system permease protein
MRLTLAVAALRRHPVRTTLAVLGVAVAAALLLDMVMLASGMRESFRSLLLTRGYQLRIAPKGTLPFDSEASVPGADAIVATLRANPAITAVSPVLGATLLLPDAPALRSTFAFGLEPDVQGDYAVEAGRDLVAPAVGDATGDGTGGVTGGATGGAGAPMRGGTSGDGPVEAVANGEFLARSGARLGDTVRVTAELSAQLRTEARTRRVVLVGAGRFFYVPAEQPALALPLTALRDLLGEAGRDRISLAMAGVQPGDSASVEAVRAWIEATVPRVTAISTETAIRQVDERLSYFRQLALILGAISLAIGFLLVTTLVTLSVNERRGEIAVLRAIGTPRTGVVAQVVLEGLLLSGAGIAGGLVLGVGTARWLNMILRDFPGLPAAFDFFVWSPGAASRALALLLVAGTLAGAWPAWRASAVPVARALREEAVG